MNCSVPVGRSPGDHLGAAGLAGVADELLVGAVRRSWSPRSGSRPTRWRRPAPGGTARRPSTAAALEARRVREALLGEAVAGARVRMPDGRTHRSAGDERRRPRRAATSAGRRAARQRCRRAAGGGGGGPSGVVGQSWAVGITAALSCLLNPYRSLSRAHGGGTTPAAVSSTATAMKPAQSAMTAVPRALDACGSATTPVIRWPRGAHLARQGCGPRIARVTGGAVVEVAVGAAVPHTRTRRARR